jgi:hypothetical protein
MTFLKFFYVFINVNYDFYEWNKKVCIVPLESPDANERAINFDHLKRPKQTRSFGRPKYVTSIWTSEMHRPAGDALEDALKSQGHNKLCPLLARKIRLLPKLAAAKAGSIFSCSEIIGTFPLLCASNLVKA